MAHWYPPPRQLPNSEEVLPHVLVGDDAFRLHRNMMKPYSREEAIGNNTKSVFNYRLCRARRTSENAFGILAQVFRIFYTPIGVLPETADKLIIVACCLHNLLRDGYLAQAGHAVYELDPMLELPKDNLIPLRRVGGFANADGFAIRDAFASYFKNEGSVTWQNKLVNRTD